MGFLLVGEYGDFGLDLGLGGVEIWSGFGVLIAIGICFLENFSNSVNYPQFLYNY